ncbi:MAG: LysR family transcriptional regulator [Herbaspirillum sp.]|jgi:molybdate transport repressor ModE-like protein|nr:LysR family transcriptional regulator [Herbaspirillum sp.]
MRFDLSDLRLFAHIADTGSITKGADRAHIALASASARVCGMEEVLGTALLVRRRRGIELTAAGRTLQHHARMVLQQVARMHDELGAYAHGVKGHIRLLCNTAAMSEFLPEALSAFMAAHPNIDIDLEERLSDDIVQAIANGAADVGIVADAVDTAGLEVFPFRSDRLVLVTARDHPLPALEPGARSVAFAQTLDQQFVGLAGDSALQRYLSEHAVRAGKPFHYRVRLRSFEAVCRMVETGVGVAIVPETAARRCQRSMRIRRVRLSDAWATRALIVCVRRLDELPSYARQLIGELSGDIRLRQDTALNTVVSTSNR